MPINETYSPAQLETEVQTLAENYRGAVNQIEQDNEHFSAIAAAIQDKDSGGTMTVDEMPARIAAIETGDNTLINPLINRSISSIESDVTTIGYSSFSKCTSLSSAIFSEAKALNSLCFEGCSRLTSMEIPKATTLNASCFYDCTRLPRIFLYSVTNIASQSFRGCSALTTVVMGKRAVLANANAFTGANSAIIYVQPEDLSWYETATNWSTLYADNRIKSVAELTGDDLTWYQQQLAKYPEEE